MEYVVKALHVVCGRTCSRVAYSHCLRGLPALSGLALPCFSVWRRNSKQSRISVWQMHSQMLMW